MSNRINSVIVSLIQRPPEKSGLIKSTCSRSHLPVAIVVIGIWKIEGITDPSWLEAAFLGDVSNR
jgi:hypothetical protein